MIRTSEFKEYNILKAEFAKIDKTADRKKNPKWKRFKELSKLIDQYEKEISDGGTLLELDDTDIKPGSKINL